MATKSKQAKVIALQRPNTGDRGMASEVLEARARAQGADAVRLADLTPNPYNPREDLTDIDELADDMHVQGVLQPLLVCSRGAFLAEQPDLADRIGSADWVILAGHRRYAAAVVAGLDSVPVHVRDDLAGPGQAARVARTENALRVGLSPLQEAKLFGDLRDRGHSQRDTAAATGVSPGQVAKRLKLLRLSPDGQEALRTGRIDVSAALVISDVAEPDVTDAIVGRALTRAHDIRPWTAADVETDLEQIRRDLTTERTRQALHDQGVTVLDRPPAWSDNLDRVTNDEAIAAAITAGVAHAVIGWDNTPTYYQPRPARDVTDPGNNRSEASAPIDTPPDRRREAWEAATTARHALIAHTLTQPLTKADRHLAVKTALRAVTTFPTSTTLRLIDQWTDGAWGTANASLSATTADEHLIPLALASYLAAAEATLSQTIRWYLNVGAEDHLDPAEEYYAWLTAHGYTISPLEEEFRQTATQHRRQAGEQDRASGPADPAENDDLDDGGLSRAAAGQAAQ